MNYYFLLEDEKSFIKVLPKWLEYMGFMCTRVVDIDAVTEDCYVMQSGQGVTRLITNVLYQTLDTILEKPGKIDHLVVIIDSEEKTIDERRNEVYHKIDEYCTEKNITLEFEVKVLVCNHCFESWLLANKKIYPDKEPEKESFFYPFYKHYNVKENDPEKMPVPLHMEETTAKYHFHYLHEALRYKKERYSKKRPDYVATNTYFKELIDRMDTTEHIQSFKEMWEYIQEQNKC